MTNSITEIEGFKLKLVDEGIGLGFGMLKSFQLSIFQKDGIGSGTERWRERGGMRTLPDPA